MLTCMGIHGHVAAVLLKEKTDVRGFALFENCETEFRFSRCIRQGSEESPVLCERWVKYVWRKAERKWKAKGWRIMFGGDDEHRFSGVMWADNYWLFNDDREMLKYLVHDIIEELMILDMESQPEFLWWTRTNKAEDGLALELRGGG